MKSSFIGASKTTASSLRYRKLPKLITDGSTRVEALSNAEEMIDAYLKTANEAGWRVPEPGGRMALHRSAGLQPALRHNF